MTHLSHVIAIGFRPRRRPSLCIVCKLNINFVTSQNYIIIDGQFFFKSGMMHLVDKGNINSKFHDYCPTGIIRGGPKMSKFDPVLKIVLFTSAHLKEKLNQQLCRSKGSLPGLKNLLLYFC